MFLCRAEDFCRPTSSSACRPPSSGELALELFLSSSHRSSRGQDSSGFPESRSSWGLRRPRDRRRSQSAGRPEELPFPVDNRMQHPHRVGPKSEPWLTSHVTVFDVLSSITSNSLSDPHDRIMSTMYSRVSLFLSASSVTGHLNLPGVSTRQMGQKLEGLCRYLVMYVQSYGILLPIYIYCFQGCI